MGRWHCLLQSTPCILRFHVCQGSGWSQFLKKKKKSLTIQRLKGQATSLVPARPLVLRPIYHFVFFPLIHHFSFLPPILDCPTLLPSISADLGYLPSGVTQTDYSRCVVHIPSDPFTTFLCTLRFSVLSRPTVST